MANRNKLRANLAQTTVHHNPGDTALNIAAEVDMRDFSEALFGYKRTVGTGATSVLKVVGSSEPSGAGDAVDILVATVDPDAVGDEAYLEISSEELADAAANNDFEFLRYASLQVQHAAGSDEAIVTVIQGGARYPQEDLTADSIA